MNTMNTTNMFDTSSMTTIPRINESVDMSNMFANCTSLIGADFNTGEYVFVQDDITYRFSYDEMIRLQSACGFKFSGKDIPRMRKITTTFMNQFYPQDLL